MGFILISMHFVAGKIMSHTQNDVGVECPWCGRVHKDSWEWDGEDGIDNCDNCGKSITWTRDTTVTYMACKTPN